MSDSSVYIVDRNVTLEEASAFANSGMRWMEATCIAIPSPGAEIAFSPVSHAPGPGIARWAKSVNEQSRSGIGAIVGRRVYNAGSQTVEALGCPCCSAEHDAASLPWQEMISAWYSGGVARSNAQAVDNRQVSINGDFYRWHGDWGTSRLRQPFSSFELSNLRGKVIDR